MTRIVLSVLLFAAALSAQSQSKYALVGELCIGSSIHGGSAHPVADERIEPCRLFSFDPQDRGSRDLGVLAVDHSPYYSWRGCQFDSMITGPEGTVHLSESERRAHLFLYMP